MLLGGVPALSDVPFGERRVTRTPYRPGRVTPTGRAVEVLAAIAALPRRGSGERRKELRAELRLALAEGLGFRPGETLVQWRSAGRVCVGAVFGVDVSGALWVTRLRRDGRLGKASQWVRKACWIRPDGMTLEFSFSKEVAPDGQSV